MPFDVEKEAALVIRAQESVPGEWHLAIDDGHERGAHLWASSPGEAQLFAGQAQRAIAILLTRCRDETEEECIKDACSLCGEGDMPKRSGEYEWWHGGFHCNANCIHERRRRREQG